MSNAYRTAIKRTRPSAPMAKLAEKDLLQGRALDYGCGRGFDAEHFGMEKYDPHFAPERPTGRFDVITCNFVLNVITSNLPVGRSGAKCGSYFSMPKCSASKPRPHP